MGLFKTEPGRETCATVPDRQGKLVVLAGLQAYAQDSAIAVTIGVLEAIRDQLVDDQANWDRRIDAQGRVFSTGFGSALDEDEYNKGLSRYLASINGQPTILDYE